MSGNTMPPDLRLEGVWVSVYSLTGIPVGTQLYLQNKSAKVMYIYEGSETPTTKESGLILQPYQVATVVTGSLDCWAFGNGAIGVQNIGS